MDLETFKNIERLSKEWTIEGLDVIEKNQESQMEEEYTINENWNKIEAYLSSLLQENMTYDYCLAELYEIICDVCNNCLEKDLYDNLSNYYINFFKEKIKGIETLDSAQIALMISELWKKVKQSNIQAKQVFIFFERSYQLTTNFQSYDQLVYNCMDTVLKEHNELKQFLVNEIQDLINMDRKGNSVDISKVTLIVDLQSDLDLYQKDFHGPLINSSKQFYNKEYSSSSIDNSDDCKIYQKSMFNSINEEKKRIQDYLDQMSLYEMVNEIEKICIINRKHEILNEKFDIIIDQKDYDILENLFQLFVAQEETDFFNKYMLNYIKKSGTKIQETSDNKQVVNLQNLHEDMVYQINKCFDENPKSKIILQAAFEQFMNQRSNNTIETYVTYFHDTLRDKQDEATIESKARKAHSIFRYIQAKDVFKLVYNQKLTKRLFHTDGSVNLNNEHNVLSLFKKECGDEFVKNSETIIEDYNDSKDAISKYNENILQVTKNSMQISENNMDVELQDWERVELGIRIMNDEIWPFNKEQTKQNYMPSPFDLISEKFAKYYKEYSNSRRLTWLHECSTCDLKASFTSGTYSISVTVIQAMILLLFNDTESMLFSQLYKQLQVDKSELKKNLVAMCKEEDKKLIIKQPANLNFGDDDVLEINKEFVNKLKRIKFSAAKLKNNKEQAEEEDDRIINERKHTVDAAVVRIMKIQRLMVESALIDTVLEKLYQIPLNRNDIKKRIESLIENEYIKRDNSDMNSYHYIP